MNTTLKFTESTTEPNRFTVHADNNWLMSILHNGEALTETQRENMRRLVACWNACQGIETLNLEENGVASMQSAIGLIRQRMQLHAGLSNLCAKMPTGTNLEVFHAKAEVVAARHAIASIETNSIKTT
jgi:hypothetical protein